MTDSTNHLPIGPLSLFALRQEFTENRRLLAACHADVLQSLAELNAIVMREAAAVQSAPRRAAAACAIAEQLGAALGCPAAEAQERMSDAASLIRDYPATFAALRAGEIEIDHVRRIQRGGVGMTDRTTRARFEHAALAIAKQHAADRTEEIKAILVGAAPRLRC
ncbi:13E12 repeat family protein [Microbacterium sp. zg-Y818]|uniref:13E12 repeat family protein n=1 Tax=unclassified Microbacterium TaxID=2609290 RepID=UPI00214AA327|nr:MULTISPECIES: 13E12 repeat family protein [unclassified Microbacterium]MCR2799799.1 13E12 repeat family protein [Microbacterium sp. zg.Y818]WIM21783.1 13E12 repeat family protein [Microbacterium sp. zg-Y818]